MIYPKTFYFARHGLTNWNEQQLCQGITDIELSEKGRLEARILGQSLENAAFSQIYTSPLKRAYETALIIQSYLPFCTLQCIEELKEREWGAIEGLSSSEMYHIEEIEEKNPEYTPGKGIEPRNTFKTRILNGFNQALNEGDPPLIISHGRVFLLLCELLNIPLMRQIPNTTLIKCVSTKSGWLIT